MNDIKIYIGSVTYAIKAQKAISARGYRSALFKREGKDKEGCTWGLSLPSKDMIAVAGILNGMGIRYRVESEKDT